MAGVLAILLEGCGAVVNIMVIRPVLPAGPLLIGGYDPGAGGNR